MLLPATRGWNAGQNCQQQNWQKKCKMCSHTFVRMQGSTFPSYLLWNPAFKLRHASIFHTFSAYILLTILLCILTMHGRRRWAGVTCSLSVTCNVINQSPCFTEGHVLLHSVMCCCQSMIFSTRTGEWRYVLSFKG